MISWEEEWNGDDASLKLELEIPVAVHGAPAVATITGGAFTLNGSVHALCGGKLHLFVAEGLRYELDAKGAPGLRGVIRLPDTPPADPWEMRDATELLQVLALRSDAWSGVLTSERAFFLERPDGLVGDGALHWSWRRDQLSKRCGWAPYSPQGVDLDYKSWRLLGLAARALMPRDKKGPRPAEVAARLDDYLEWGKPGMLRVIKTLMPLLDKLAVAAGWLAKKFFELVRKLLEDPQSPGYDDLRTIYEVVAFLYYSHPKADVVLRHRRPRLAPDQRDRPREVKRTPPEHTKAVLAQRWDVVVVGSGPAGGVVAERLVRAGHSVLILESGPFEPPRHDNTDELKGFARLYRDSGLAQGSFKGPNANRDARLVTLQGHCVGGGASVNNVICFRMHRETEARWRSIGFPVSSADLHEAYCAIANELDIKPVRRVELCEEQNPTYMYVEDKWGEPKEPGSGRPESGFFDVLVNVAEGEDSCLGSGLSNIGTYSFRRRSVMEVHLPEATHSDRCELVPDATVERLESDGTRVQAVEVDVGGALHRVECDRVVLAAGSLGTSAILRRTKGLTKLPYGERFSCNLATPLFAMYDKPVGAGGKVQMSHYYAEGQGAPRWLLETWFNPPASHALVVGGTPSSHQERMADYTHTAGFGVVVPSGPNGTVDREGRPSLRLSDVELSNIKDAFRAGLQALFTSNPRHAIISYGAGLTISRGFEIELALADIVDINKLVLSTAHPQGGAAMGKDGVVDGSFRVHGIDNLWVADSSLFPQGVGVNPQWTVMALAHLCATHVK